MKALVLFLMTFALALPLPLHAQADDINPEIANCEEIRDPATQTQVDFCTAHVGCKLVMGVQKACTKVKTFLNKLKNLSFGKSNIDSSDVFDAAAPSTDGDESFNLISKTIKSSYSQQPKREITSGKFENGVRWVYEGGISNGVRNGTGVLITDTGTTFRGDFVEGRQAGLGEIFNDKGYKGGVMANAKMDGVGVERFSDGTRYEGEFKADERNGKGVMTWPNGDRYEGDFKDGWRNGQGTFKWSDGDQYTGDFLKNQRTGQGTYTEADGSICTGEYKNGKKSGKGTCKWTNGNQYSGNWVDNNLQSGTYKWADGTTYTGEFRGGKMFNGTKTNADGSRTRIANGDSVEDARPQSEAATGQQGNGVSLDALINAGGTLLNIFADIEKQKQQQSEQGQQQPIQNDYCNFKYACP